MNARRILLPALLAAALLIAIGPARGQPSPPVGAPQPATHVATSLSSAAVAAAPSKLVAIQRTTAKGTNRMAVTSPQIRASSAIPARHTAYGDNVSPALAWSAVDGARSYVLLLEDPDAPSAQPFVHWVAWNIPANVHALAEGLPTRASPTAVRGMVQGRNDRDGTGYFGPRPPAGDAPHHYHFQLFALDRMLDLPLGATRNDVVAAMAGHVLAEGELVATSQAPKTH